MNIREDWKKNGRFRLRVAVFLMPLRVIARNEAIQTVCIYMDCFIIPPRNDAKRVGAKPSESLLVCWPQQPCHPNAGLCGGMGSMAASCWGVCVKRCTVVEIPYGNGGEFKCIMRR